MYCCRNIRRKAIPASVGTLRTLSRLTVSELVGWVRNVVLIKCIFGFGKPRGVRILGGRVYGPGEGTRKLVYEQPGNEVDGSCHKRRVPSK